MRIEDLLTQTEDQPIPGGCERCDAYQTIQAVGPGVFEMIVHHDDWCPLMRTRASETN